MTKPGRSAKWVRQSLRRDRQTRAYHRYIRPAVSLLRWEGVILVGALGFGVVSRLPDVTDFDSMGKDGPEYVNSLALDENYNDPSPGNIGFVRINTYEANCPL